jgi:hypothetical protein
MYEFPIKPCKNWYATQNEKSLWFSHPVMRDEKPMSTPAGLKIVANLGGLLILGLKTKLLIDSEKAYVEGRKNPDFMQDLLNFRKIATITTTSEIPHYVPECCKVRIHIKLSQPTESLALSH